MNYRDSLEELRKQLNIMDGDIRVVVTGSRNWSNLMPIISVVSLLSETNKVVEVIHGDARGVDKFFAHESRRFGIPKITTVPAIWNKHSDVCGPPHSKDLICRRAGYMRNQKMVDMKPDLCIAFNKNNSKGTSMMISICEKAGIPTIVFPDY